MKKSNTKSKKLTKKELKEINGGRVVCPRVISCIDRHTGQERYGVPGVQDDYCC